MKKVKIDKIVGVPKEFDVFLKGAEIFDSSCSPEARVYYIKSADGLYLKTAAKGTLQREALMTDYFHKKGLGAEVIDFKSLDNDWFLTTAVKGEDCVNEIYLSDPKRLCDTLAVTLRALHEIDFSDCPIKDRVSEYLTLAEENFETGNYDKSHFPDSFGYRSAKEAYKVLQEGKGALKNEVLIHGDYCLPNIMLDDWKFSDFIDVGNGGVGDRHIDLFWGTWTLWFNLNTNDYYNRFLDAYGRDKVDTEILKTVAAAEVFG
ncbi:MAG: aminoglycoside 3'-phosphotransferase [Clostridia bacterium]|nr:aminoglycoside 3'-phosphotransferase [Clostridia bacterium]